MIRALLALAVFVSTSAAIAAPGEISGQVSLAKGVTTQSGGALFVIARNEGQPMPVAVLRVADPKFPLKFTLTKDHAMMPGTPFTGSYVIVARFSPRGDAMDKTGPEAISPKAIAVGTADVKLEMKAK